MTLCCAGVILAATSNYGCSFILLRTHFDAAGRQETTRELRALCVMFAALTGFAFGSMSFSDITIIKELSWLTIVSVALTILSVHTFLPKLLTSLTLPAPFKSPLYSMCERFCETGKRSAVIGAVFTIGMLIYCFQASDSNPLMATLNFKLLAFIGFGLTSLAFFFFFDWKLTLLTVTPVLFAILNLAGVMRLTGYFANPHTSVLLIIVMTTSVGYALFFIRSFQRYGGHSHPAFKLTTLAIFMGFVLIIVGCAILSLTRHPVMQSAGIILSLGALFNQIGIFIFMPTALAYLFRPAPMMNCSANLDRRILQRYKQLEAYPRLFAAFKLRYDAMFRELPAFLEPFCTGRKIRTIIDIGCGYGVPAAWLIERFPRATVYGIDPDRIRVRVASLVLRAKGVVKQNRAPTAPKVADSADIALMLDMIHFLNDAELKLTLQRLHRNLRPNALLIIRTVIPPHQRPSQIWHFENFKHRLFKVSPCYRTADTIHNHIVQAGFKLEKKTPSGSIGELVWFIAKSVS